MSMLVAICLALPSLFCLCVEGRSAGAPDSACAAISPSLAGHLVGPQTSTSPFTLTVEGSPTYYTPGADYNLTLSSTQTFLGFLIIGRDMNSVNVGSFTPRSGQVQACVDSLGITHSPAMSRTSAYFTWTAPSNGTGIVTLRFAAVIARAQYWANQPGPQLYEEGTTSTASTVLAGSMTVASLILSFGAFLLIL